jgi:hypothetical protein
VLGHGLSARIAMCLPHVRGLSRPPLLVCDSTICHSSDPEHTFFSYHRFHSISFTRAQGIPKYKIGFGRERRMGELGRDWLRGVGVTVPVTLVTVLLPCAPLPLASCTCACGQCGLWIRQWLSTPAGKCRPSENPPLCRRKEGGGVAWGPLLSYAVLCALCSLLAPSRLSLMYCCIILCPRCVGLRVSQTLCRRTP